MKAIREVGLSIEQEVFCDLEGKVVRRKKLIKIAKLQCNNKPAAGPNP